MTETSVAVSLAASPPDVGSLDATPDEPSRRWRGVALGVTIVAATVVAYIPALRAGYIWDDGQYLHQNDLVQSNAGLAAVWAIRSDSESGRLMINTPQYYPLVYTSYWLEYKLWGLKPFGYHLVNVLLHALSALLLWRIGGKIGLPGAWFVAAVFALHPVQVESVAWITERKNVLSGFFYFLSLAVFLNYFERRRVWAYLLGMLLFAAALLSKTVTCSLPVAILLILWFKRRRIGFRDVLALAPVFVVGAVGGLFTAYLERTHVGAAGMDWGQTFLERVTLIAPRAYLFYAEKIAWPHPLVFIYPRWNVSAEAWADYAPIAAGSAVLLAAAAGVRRFGWGPLLLLLFSGATLTPALGFFEVYPHRFSWVADHFQYLGGIGFIALYVAIIVWLGRRLLSEPAARRLGRVGAVGVLIVLGVLTYRHGRDFKDAVTLWERTLAANPDAWIASINLGISASADGRHDEAAKYFEHTIRYPVARSEGYGSWGTALLHAGRPEAAAEKLTKALEVDPHNAKAYVGLAAALGQLGRLSESRTAMEKALEINPEYVTAWLGLGRFYVHQRSWDEADRCFRRARDLTPCIAGVRLAYASMLFDAQRWRAAASEYEAAARLAPSKFHAMYKLAKSLYESGAYADALRTCRRGLEQRPDSVRLQRLTAWIRAACPVGELRDGAEAIGIIEQMPSSARGDLRNLDVLACAYAETGDFKKAAKLAATAAAAARKNGAAELAERIDARARLFRAGKPFRHKPS